MDRGFLFRGSHVGLYFPLAGVALYYRGLSPCVLIDFPGLGVVGFVCSGGRLCLAVTFTSGIFLWTTPKKAGVEFCASIFSGRTAKNVRECIPKLPDNHVVIKLFLKRQSEVTCYAVTQFCSYLIPFKSHLLLM
jgi:hypothetical protein